MANSTVRDGVSEEKVHQRIVTFVEKCIHNHDCQQIFREGNAVGLNCYESEYLFILFCGLKMLPESHLLYIGN